MKVFILIFILVGDGARATAIEFNSRESCELASLKTQENKPSLYGLKSFCVEK